MNRRVSFLLVVLVVAGVLTVSGAFPQPAPQTTRKVFNAPEKTVQAPYSDGILAGNTLYLAGRIGLDPKTGKLYLPTADFKAPAEGEQRHTVVPGTFRVLVVGEK